MKLDLGVTKMRIMGILSLDNHSSDEYTGNEQPGW
jgi:hypothetical protein